MLGSLDWLAFIDPIVLVVTAERSRAWRRRLVVGVAAVSASS